MLGPDTVMGGRTLYATNIYFLLVFVSGSPLVGDLDDLERDAGGTCMVLRIDNAWKT